MAAPPSPRLPSPPPFTEVQIDPASTSTAATESSATTVATSPTTSTTVSSNPPPAAKPPPVVRRIRPGSKSKDISSGPPPAPLNELDSAFQLQEHLASLLTAVTTAHPDSTNSEPHTIPISKEAAQNLANPPPGIDSQLWCYELTRRLTRDLNHLIVALLQDNCTSKTCPQMRASEWQYLCAVHDPPQSCCAIDYSCHTLDHAATILTSSRYFPSRLSLTAQGGKHLSSIFRRLYRIFAHAWFQHRSVFWEVEGEWGLYLFFKTVSERYNLVPEDNLTIPPEAEGASDEAVNEKDEFKRDHGMRGSLHGEDNDKRGGQEGEDRGQGGDEDEEEFGSDDSDESDDGSGSGSDGDGDGNVGEGDAFDLELPEDEGSGSADGREGVEGQGGSANGEEDVARESEAKVGTDTATQEAQEVERPEGADDGEVEKKSEHEEDEEAEGEEQGEEVVLVLDDNEHARVSSPPRHLTLESAGVEDAEEKPETEAAASCDIEDKSGMDAKEDKSPAEEEHYETGKAEGHNP